MQGKNWIIGARSLRSGWVRWKPDMSPWVRSSGAVDRTSQWRSVAPCPVSMLDIALAAVRWYLRFGRSYRDLDKLLAERGSTSIASPVSLGATLHANVDRRGATVPPRRRGAMVHRRDLREGRRALAIRLSSGRRGRPCHRRAHLQATRHKRSTRSPRSRSAPIGQPRGSRHRRADAGRGAQHRAVRQPDRVRPPTTHSAAASDARRQDRPDRRVVIRGHAFMQNLRRGHYEVGVEARYERLRIASPPRSTNSQRPSEFEFDRAGPGLRCP